jgi:LysM repeat protein
MTAGPNDRRLVKIRRRGRHSTPSQVERVAVQAGKAAPAVAIAGALVAVPGAQSAFAAQDTPATATQTHEAVHADQAGHTGTAATLDSISTRSVTVSSTSHARHAAQVRSSHYTVRSGDTLSKIAQHFYDKAADWGYLYHENAKTVSDPNLIFVGQSLDIPATVPADYKLADYEPRHAAPVTVTATAESSSDSSSSSSGSSNSNTGGRSAVVVQSASQVSSAGSSGGLGGTLSCSGLEQLWTDAGGNSADAFMAAEIAEAESGGNQYALSPTDDYGYWQINASNGALATFNAYGNARSAIILSDDGGNWNAWTTYRSGAYEGRC